MVKIDKSSWPMVVINVDELRTLPEMEEYNAEMEKLLDFAEQQPDKFGIVYLYEGTDEDAKTNQREKEAQKLSKEWLKQNKSRFEAKCIGIAMVTQATGLLKMMRPIANRTIKHMMGAPGAVFFAKEEAEAWLTELMTSPET